MSLLAREKISAQPKIWFSPLVVVLLVVSLVVFLPWIVHSRSIIAELQEHIELIRKANASDESEISKLKNGMQRKEELEYRSRLLELQAFQVFRQCREAADIPQLTGPFMAGVTHTTQIHGADVSFFVPQGEHRLIIEFIDSASQEEGAYRYEYPLLPNAGYMLETVYEDDLADESPFHFVLTCAKGGFDETMATIPISGFKARSSSRAPPNFLCFPGEVSRNHTGSGYSTGVEIMRLGWWNAPGITGDRTVKATAKILSKGLPCANPREAWRMASMLPSQNLLYGENGRVDLPDFDLENQPQ